MDKSASDRPQVLVGKTVVVRTPDVEPTHFTELHRARVGATGVIHAVVASQPRDNPLIKVKFGDEGRIVFFRLSDLDVRGDEPAEPPSRHGRRSSHLPGGG